MIQFEVGKAYEEFKNRENKVQFDLADDGAFLLVFFKSPTQKEVEQFHTNMPFEMKFVQIKNVLMFTVKIGGLNWMDAPYSPHLSLDLTKLSSPMKGEGLALTLFLIDSDTGTIKHMRFMGLAEEFSRNLLGKIMDEKMNSFDVNQYYINLNNIYNKYTIKDLVKLCSYKDSFKFHGVSNG